MAARRASVNASASLLEAASALAPSKMTASCLPRLSRVGCSGLGGGGHEAIAEGLLVPLREAGDLREVERYPDRLGRTVLGATAQAVFGMREHPGEDPVQFIAEGWL